MLCHVSVVRWPAHQVLLRSMTLPNLWTVHPKLQPFTPDGVDGECSTCFRLAPEEAAPPQPPRGGGHAHEAAAPAWWSRGPVSPAHRLVTPQGHAFQIDGNMGAMNAYQVGRARGRSLAVLRCTLEAGPAGRSAYLPFGVVGLLVACMQELLVQSWRSEVRLLPALPSMWQGGRVSGLLTRAGLSLEDMQWDGELGRDASHDALAVTGWLVRVADDDLEWCVCGPWQAGI